MNFCGYPGSVSNFIRGHGISFLSGRTELFHQQDMAMPLSLSSCGCDWRRKRTVTLLQPLV